jgi:AcrR family transcriptional regulator
MATKEKILDTAERLIASQGFAATSLRQIISEAQVNLAAVHYHFGSKEELLDQLVLRKVTRVNEEREALLERFEREAGGDPVPVEKILAAFFQPMIEAGSRNPQFVRLMGRLIAEGLIPSIAEKHFQPTTTRFIAAWRRALPHLPEGELYWRVQFMFGAMSHTIGGLALSVPQIHGDGSDFKLLMRRLMAFLGAGMNAPPTKEIQMEMQQ